MWFHAQHEQKIWTVSISQLPDILKEKKMENLESIDIDYFPTMSSGWTTVPQMYINAIDNFDKVLTSILELEITSLTIGFGALGNMIEIRCSSLKYSIINYHIKVFKDFNS